MVAGYYDNSLALESFTYGRGINMAGFLLILFCYVWIGYVVFVLVPETDGYEVIADGFVFALLIHMSVGLVWLML